MTVWMAERDLRGIGMDALGAARGAAIAEAGKSTAHGTPVHYLRSMFTPADGRCCCLFEAAGADAVRAVNDAVALPYQRVVPAMDLPPPG